MTEKEFNDQLQKLSDLYEEAKDCLYNLHFDCNETLLQKLHSAVKDMRDLSATTMQKLYWKHDN